MQTVVTGLSFASIGSVHKWERGSQAPRAPLRAVLHVGGYVGSLTPADTFENALLYASGSCHNMRIGVVSG